MDLKSIKNSALKMAGQKEMSKKSDGAS